MSKMFKKIIVALLALALVFSIIPNNTSAATYDKATTVKKIKVYQKAGTSYKMLFTVAKGKSVKVIGGVAIGSDQGKLASYQQFGFSKISYKNKTGYVKTSDLNYKNPYQWAPGVKKKAVTYAKHYAKGNTYRFIKSGTYKTVGNYQVQVKFEGKWQTIGGINCKTGWVHG